jgi:glutathione synthase/RimK-type ligase-like ATP-grasp enzyme
MFLFNKLIKRFLRIYFLFAKVNFLRLLKLHKKNSKNVVWILNKNIKYWGSDTCIWDFATISYFMDNNIPFKIKFGSNIGKISNSNILFTLNDTYNLFNFNNYNNSLLFIANELENQNNVLFPKKNELIFWENKIYMHKKFNDLGIKSPKTIIKSINDTTIDLPYPFLLKEPHSCASKGVHLIKNQEEYILLKNDIKFKLNNIEFLLQELIPMRKDLRVIIVKNEIVSYYWRINKSDTWKPTSTSYGSDVDFNNFPSIWKDLIIDNINKLNLTAGAFDITWYNDDITTEPYFLEVSPVFQPNPKIGYIEDTPYASYKNSIRLFNSWENNYINIIFIIKDLYLKNFISEFK